MWVVSVLGGGWWAAYNAGSGRPEYLKAAPRSALAICFKQTTLTTTGQHLLAVIASRATQIICVQPATAATSFGLFN